MAKKNFKTIIESKVKRGSIPTSNFESRDWYRRKAQLAREFKASPPKKFIQMGSQNKRLKTTLKQKQMLGKLYMFEYEAKPVEPFYDAFPVVFPFELREDGFLGMNLHYLPYNYRAFLMDNLYSLVNNEEADQTTRLQLANNGYNILNKSAKYRYFKPCIKRYLYENVKSRYMEIPADEWEIALFLPLERFVGTTKRSVWADSRKKV